MAQASGHDSDIVNHIDLVRHCREPDGLDLRAELLVTAPGIYIRGNNMDISRKTAAFVDEYRKIQGLRHHFLKTENGASDET